MPSYNHLCLIGHLTRDPELSHLPSNTQLCKGGLAVNRKYKTAGGEQKEEVLFLDFVIFGKQAEVFQQYMSKGACVLLEGELRLETWEDKDGGKRSKHSMNVRNFRFMDPPQESKPAQRSMPERDAIPPERRFARQAPPSVERDMGEDVPF